MTLTELNKDLFSVSKEYALVHCISSDRAMGAGIAVKFAQMGVKTAIQREYGPVMAYGNGATNRWHGRGYCLPVTVNDQLIINLVTKCRYWQKPTMKTLNSALLDMKEVLEEENCRKIAMPMIGCGLDKLDPLSVKEMIKDVFSDTDIEIIICYL